MAKKNSFVIIVFIIFLLLIFSLAAYFTYKNAYFPAFNQFIDSKISYFTKREIIDSEPLLVESSPIYIPSGSIQNKDFFCYRVLDKNILSRIESLFQSSFYDETENFHYTYSKEYQSIKLRAMFQKLDENFDPLDESLGSWTFAPTIPLTRPSLFQDALVFIDAKASLIILDLKTGKLIREIPSPVYPSSSALAIILPIAIPGFSETQDAYPQYIFKAADTNVYAFAFFENKFEIENFLLKEKQSNDLETKHPYILTEAIQKTIMQSIADWAQYKELPTFIDPIMLSKDPKPVLINREGISIFVFMVEEEGKYLLGMSDEKSNFIKADALASLFSQKGEMLSISIHYESHSPQVEAVLDSDTLYYMVLANKGEKALENTYFSYKKIK